MLKDFRFREKILLSGAFTLLLISLFFSHYSESSVFNGESFVSNALELISYLLFIFIGGYVFYQRYKQNEISVFKSLSINYITIFALLFTGIISTRSGIRFVMILNIITIISVCYLVVEMLKKAWKSTEEVNKIVLWICATAVFLAFAFTAINYYDSAKATASSSIPSSYTQQWQEAMSWVRESTPTNAVFGHWWDYGYWLQSIGERATMLDGGNAIGYWNYLMGRYVLTGQSEEEALEVLYNHNVTYFLIDSTDIGKYSAYSSIGSDENYDRFSWIGTFFLDEQQIQETKNKTIYVYSGGIALDEDLRINENGNTILLPRQAAAVGAIIVYQNADGDYEQPEIVLVYKKKQYRLPIRYLDINNELLDFGAEREGTINSCAYIIPRINGDKLQMTGALMYLSQRNMKALWVKMYLFNQVENFKLVHSEPSSLHKNYFISQNISINDFVYYPGAGIQGPIKIWEINYAGDEKANQEYLQKTFPEEIASRRFK